MMQPLSKTNAEAYFWQMAEQGKLVLPRCRDTQKCFFYPRNHSPFTGGDIEWVESKGTGEIYSCSINHRSETPYCIAYVQLDEGPIILTNIVDEDLTAVKIGQKVYLQFKTHDDGKSIPFFTTSNTPEENNNK